jgi:hypothetical protein
MRTILLLAYVLALGHRLTAQDSPIIVADSSIPDELKGKAKGAEKRKATAPASMPTFGIEHETFEIESGWLGLGTKFYVQDDGYFAKCLEMALADPTKPRDIKTFDGKSWKLTLTDKVTLQSDSDNNRIDIDFNQKHLKARGNAYGHQVYFVNDLLNSAQLTISGKTINYPNGQIAAAPFKLTVHYCPMNGDCKDPATQKDVCTP